MLWIKEVEIAETIDELVTSRSMTGQRNLPDFDMLVPEKRKCPRAASSEFRPILTRKTNCVYDLRVFPCSRSV